MALANYSDLKTAVFNEFVRNAANAAFTNAIPDLISRAESQINRRTRLRKQEDQNTWDVTSAATNKLLSLPAGFVEKLVLEVKGTGEDDTDYCEVKYVNPEVFQRFYRDAGEAEYYTIRDEIELNRKPGSNLTYRMHYIKDWDIATDTTNWLLTNHPDVYLYGAFVQADMWWRGDFMNMLPTHQNLFRDAMTELNKVANRSRNNSRLSTREYSSYYDKRYGYQILQDTY